jgi:hypothetical protein
MSGAVGAFYNKVKDYTSNFGISPWKMSQGDMLSILAEKFGFETEISRTGVDILNQVTSFEKEGAALCGDVNTFVTSLGGRSIASSCKALPGYKPPVETGYIPWLKRMLYLAIAGVAIYYGGRIVLGVMEVKGSRISPKQLPRYAGGKR